MQGLGVDLSKDKFDVALICQRPPGLHHPWSGHVHHLECW
jgi:hypothetical protein